MYWFKVSLKQEFVGGLRQNYIAKLLDITQTHLSKILNGRTHVNKITAYALIKMVRPEASIEDYFIRKEK